MNNPNMITVTKYIRGPKGKIEISFDDCPPFTIYRSEAASLSLEEDARITPEQYQYLLKDLVGKRAKKRALYLLTQMDRSEKKLTEKLTECGYPTTCVEEAIEYVKKYHYLDDRRYASNFIRCSQDRMSRQQLVRKLVDKGIPRHIACDAAEEEYTSDEREQIRRLLDKKGYDPGTADDKERRRVYAFLARRGFGHGDIMKELQG